MKRKRHISSIERKTRLQKNKENKKYPFKESTALADFIKPKFRNELRALITRLRPFLMNDLPENVLQTTRLEFDWHHPQCTPTRICLEFALFFVSTGGNIAETLGVDKKGRRWKIIELIRYMISKEHGNFMLSEKSLKALIDSKIKEVVNIR